MFLATSANAASFSCPVDVPTADKEPRARALFEEALRLEPGNPDAALLRLGCAEELVQRPAVALRIGIIADRLGRYRQAIDAFRNYLKRLQNAAPDQAEIEARISKLLTLEAKKAEQQAAAADPRPRTLGVVLAAAGGVVFIAGGGLLIAAKVHNDQVHDIEPGTTSWDSEEARNLFEQAELEQSLGLGLLIGGGLMIGTGLGVALWPVGQQAERVSLRVSPTQASLRLLF